MNKPYRKRKAVFLDRDGTINIDKDYIHKIEDFEFLPGAVDALKELEEDGFLLIVVTNQSGIGRGFYTEDDFFILNNFFLSELEKVKVHIAKVYYCPHLPDASIIKYRMECSCRKPKTGMFMKAASDFGIDLDNSFAVGDKMRDLAITDYFETRGILLYSDSNFNNDNVYGIRGGLEEAVSLIRKLSAGGCA